MKLNYVGSPDMIVLGVVAHGLLVSLMVLKLTLSGRLWVSLVEGAGTFCGFSGFHRAAVYGTCGIHRRGICRVFCCAILCAFEGCEYLTETSFNFCDRIVRR